MKITKYASTAALMLLILVMSSCTTAPVCIAPSTTPVTSNMEIKNLGRMKGSDTAWSVLGLWMIDRPDIDRAIRNAISGSAATAMINVTCYESTQHFIIVSMTTVTVEGEGVTLTPVK